MLPSRLALLALSIALAPSASVSAAETDHHFDGAWDTVLSCENTAAAQGYSLKSSSVVKDGVLHGEREPRENLIDAGGHADLSRSNWKRVCRCQLAKELD
jgi:hypothetical protein